MLKFTPSVIAFALGVLLGSAHATPPSDANSGASSAGNTSGASTGQNASGAGATTTIEVPMVVLVPVQVRADPNFANGCWVRLFDGTNYKGNDELTIAGPIDMQTLRTPSGINWRRKADSLIVGPKATVQVFENEFFKDKTVTFKPGQQVPSLRKELGFLHSIDSLKVSCG